MANGVCIGLIRDHVLSDEEKMNFLMMNNYNDGAEQFVMRIPGLAFLPFHL